MFSIYNFVRTVDRDTLLARLAQEGYALRHLDGAGVTNPVGLWAASSKQLGHAAVGGWDAYADRVAGALMPDDDEPDRVALVWEHADDLANADLATFCAAFDALTTVGRAAYAQGTTILLFFIGVDFPPVAPS